MKGCNLSLCFRFSKFVVAMGVDIRSSQLYFPQMFLIIRLD